MNTVYTSRTTTRIAQSLLILIVSYFFTQMAMAGPVASNLKVVVSIPPFYALVSEIMKGVGSSPVLVVKAGASVHHAVLSPKDVQTLDEADLIFWGGPNLETFLVNPINIVKSQNKTIVELDKTPGIQWLATRYSPRFKTAEQATDVQATDKKAGKNSAQKHKHEHEHEHGHGHGHSELQQGHDHDIEHSHHDHDHGHDHAHGHDHGPIDMHFWLDPDNALVLVDAITEQLSLKDPSHRAQYEQNAKTLKKEIKDTDAKLKQSMSPIRSKAYLVFHDGYQYFEHHYGLNAVGAITADPELPVSIERLKTIREMIETQKVECVFSEPNTNPKLVQTLAKDFHLRMGVLDPLESPEPSKNVSYPALLEGLSDSLVTCLERQKQP